MQFTATTEMLSSLYVHRLLEAVIVPGRVPDVRMKIIADDDAMVSHLTPAFGQQAASDFITKLRAGSIAGARLYQAT